jgi:hypothetical protein
MRNSAFHDRANLLFAIEDVGLEADGCEKTLGHKDVHEFESREIGHRRELLDLRESFVAELNIRNTE